MKKFTFGKYKNTEICVCEDLSYLEWVVENVKDKDEEEMKEIKTVKALLTIKAKAGKLVKNDMHVTDFISLKLLNNNIVFNIDTLLNDINESGCKISDNEVNLDVLINFINNKKYETLNIESISFKRLNEELFAYTVKNEIIFPQIFKFLGRSALRTDLERMIYDIKNEIIEEECYFNIKEFVENVEKNFTSENIYGNMGYRWLKLKIMNDRGNKEIMKQLLNKEIEYNKENLIKALKKGE